MPSNNITLRAQRPHLQQQGLENLRPLPSLHTPNRVISGHSPLCAGPEVTALCPPWEARPFLERGLPRAGRPRAAVVPTAGPPPALGFVQRVPRPRRVRGSRGPPLVTSRMSHEGHTLSRAGRRRPPRPRLADTPPATPAPCRPRPPRPGRPRPLPA